MQNTVTILVTSVIHRTTQALKIRVWRSVDGGIGVDAIWIPQRGIVRERSTYAGLEVTLWSWVATAKGIAASANDGGYRTGPVPDPRPVAILEQAIRDRQASGLPVDVLRAELRRARQHLAIQRRVDAQLMPMLQQALKRDEG